MIDLQELKQRLTDRGWEFGRELGRGAFGVVLEARVEGVNCAVKFIAAADGRAERERQALEPLVEFTRHPRMLALQSVISEEGWLVTRWELADQTLLDRLRECGGRGLPRDELYRYLREVAEAIDMLNSRGVIHRDVKPGNIFLVQGHAKLGDLGLAKFVGESIAPNSAFGTPGYSPPEAARNESSPTFDLYSLAATFVLLRTGRPAFDSQSFLAQQREGKFNLDGLTEHEQRYVRQALAIRAADRPSAGAVAWCAQLASGDETATGSYVPAASKPAPRAGSSLRARLDQELADGATTHAMTTVERLLEQTPGDAELEAIRQRLSRQLVDSQMVRSRLERLASDRERWEGQFAFARWTAAILGGAGLIEMGYRLATGGSPSTLVLAIGLGLIGVAAMLPMWSERAVSDWVAQRLRRAFSGSLAERLVALEMIEGSPTLREFASVLEIDSPRAVADSPTTIDSAPLS